MTSERVLIVKNKNNRLTAKVRRRVSKGYVPDDYVKVINPIDANDLALFFEDLELLANAPIEKAFRRFKDNKEKGNPFF